MDAYHQAFEDSAALHTGLLIPLDVLNVQTPLRTSYIGPSLLASSVSGYQPSLPYEIPGGCLSSNIQFLCQNVKLWYMSF